MYQAAVATGSPQRLRCRPQPFRLRAPFRHPIHRVRLGIAVTFLAPGGSGRGSLEDGHESPRQAPTLKPQRKVEWSVHMAIARTTHMPKTVQAIDRLLRSTLRRAAEPAIGRGVPLLPLPIANGLSRDRKTVSSANFGRRVCNSKAFRHSGSRASTPCRQP